MLALIIATAAFRQSPAQLPAFATWDGKSFAGIAVGISENDLGKQFVKSKTVGPDPASVRIGVDKKGWILTAILTGTNNKGHVAGFVAEMERDQPIESFETLQGELGNPDYSAFAATRYSDWSLEVWASKGIGAVVQNGSRPRVMKVLLAPPDVLAKNLDLWERSPNGLKDPPRIPVTGFDVSISSDPRNRDLEDEIERRIRRLARRLMEGDGGSVWYPSDSGSRIRISFSVKPDKNTTLNGSASITYTGELGNQSFNESNFDTVDHNRDFRDRTESMFDDLMGKLNHDIEGKLKRLTWQTEWRQVTVLPRVRN